MTNLDRLPAAVEARIINAEQARRLTDFLTNDERASDASAKPVGDPPADAEYVRFARGFHDVFLTIGISILLIGASLSFGYFNEIAGGLIVALLSWALAEFYTRRRRLVLPSLALAVGFAFGCALAAYHSYFWTFGVFSRPSTEAGVPHTSLIRTAMVVWYSGHVVAMAAAALAGLLFRYRFGLPFALAIAAAPLAMIPIYLLDIVVPEAGIWLRQSVILVPGICVFILAMSFDLSDPKRQTLGADNAFWLHLVSAPLIIHGSLGFVWDRTDASGALQTGEALVVIAGIAVLALVAVAIDRRALLVSGLVYLGFAIGSILIATKAETTLVVALTLMLLGAGVVLVGSNWQRVRRAIVSRVLPASVALRLPSLNDGTP